MNLAMAIIAAGFITYRFHLMLVPFFHKFVLQTPISTLLCGLASDIMVLGSIFLLLSPVYLLKLKWQRILAVPLFIFALLLLGSFAGHLRYVEHFGMSLRPFHIGAMLASEVSSVGVAMVLGSWLCISFLVVSLLLTPVFAKYFHRMGGGFGQWSLKKFSVVALSTVVVIALANSTMLNLRYTSGLHSELRYNPISSLVFLFQDARVTRIVEALPPEKVLKIRELLSGNRHFEDMADYPLWQSQIVSQESSTLTGLRRFLTSDSDKPWNVVFVMLESFRANEISGFTDTERARQLTPRFGELVSKGVAFTEVYSTGLRTHFGQVAGTCGLLGVDDFTVMVGAPLTRANCLANVFSSHEYQTHFFYGADNHFDNQDTFHDAHGFRNIYDENNMETGVVEGGWGASDWELFRFTKSTLAEEQTPFFSMVLTLTYHPPFKLPADASSDVKAMTSGMEEQLISYVDEKLDAFIEQMEQQNPRTIFVVTADHGKFFGEKKTLEIPKLDFLRQIARIPLLIYIPGMPESLQGTKIPNIASSVDIPSTILALMGWENTPNQFMGQSAFTRQGPVYMDWHGHFIKIDSTGSSVTEVTGDSKSALAYMNRFNLFAPLLAPTDSK